MLSQLIRWTKESLRVKVMLSIASTVIILMGVNIYVTVFNSTQVVLEREPG